MIKKHDKNPISIVNNSKIDKCCERVGYLQYSKNNQKCALGKGYVFKAIRGVSEPNRINLNPIKNFESRIFRVKLNLKSY